MTTCMLLFLLIVSFVARGQGCIPVRNIVGFGQFMRTEYEGLNAEPTSWLVNVNTRYLKIARSYGGSKRTGLLFEDERINESFTVNFGVVRLLSDRWALGVDFPVTANSRTTWQEHDPTNPDKVHHTVHSFGIGDIRFTAYKWLWRTTEMHRGNIQLGLGLKLPTGDYKYQDYFHKATGKIVAPVNSTIQLGDGGTGFTTELNAYYNLTGMMSVYGNFFYLFNPRDQNGVSSIDGGGTPNPTQIETGDFVNSVPDSYTARAGVNFTAKKLIFWSGARIEGQPTYDLIGKSNGTRRSGYTISVEPGVNYKLKNSILYLFVPLSVKRKTQQTVPDIRRSDLDGKYFRSSGGFADYMIFVGALFKL
jgi:hypothetical protein